MIPPRRLVVKHSRILPALALVVLLAVAVVVMAALAPAAPQSQSASGSPEVAVTPIPLPGMDAMNSPLQVPTPAAAYIADNPLQSPLETPMP
jgi:hypothetical protein